MRSILFVPLLLFISWSTPALSQLNSGSIKIIISPANAIILLDGDTVTNGIYSVKTGTHIIQAWAPKMKLYSSKVEVVAGKESFVGYSLRYTEDYRVAYNEYRSKSLKVGIKKTSLIMLPWLSTSIVGVLGLNKISNLKNDLNGYEQQLNYIIEEHKNSTLHYEVISFEEHYAYITEEYNKTLDQLNKVERNTIIAVSVLGALSVYSTIYAKKIKKPEFKYEVQDPSFSTLKIGLGNQLGKNFFITYNF